jgi:hypothetical protein
MYRRPHLLSVILCCYLLGSCALFLPLQHTYAHASTSTDSNPITITQQQNTLHFPGSIDFQLQAHDSNSTIQEATLYLKYNQDMSFSEQHTVQATHAAATVSLTWQENTSSSQYNPVGTLITYYWMIIDNTGNAYTGPPQTLHIFDNRFQWQQLAEGEFHVHWYGQNTNYGQLLETLTSAHIQRISQKLGVGLQQPIDLWVYGSAYDFRGSLSARANEWVGGIAFPETRQAEIVVTFTNDEALRRDMPHELTHLIFYEQTQIRVPTWFDEGLAVDNQQFHEPTMLNTYQKALSSHSLFPLTSIATKFPASAQAANLAYAESWQLVDYMYKTFGQQKMIALIKSTGLRNKTFNQDLQQTLGLSSTQLENKWRLSIDQPLLAINPATSQGLPLPVPIISLVDPLQPYLLSAGSLLIVIALLGCLSFLMLNNRRRKHELAYRQALRTMQAAPPLTPEPSSYPGYSSNVNYYNNPSKEKTTDY